MRISPDFLRLTTRLTACFSAVILAVLCGNAWAATENVWQGASQGDWDVAANWSLGHAPTAGECAVLPDTGSSYAIAVNGDRCGSAMWRSRFTRRRSIWQPLRPVRREPGLCGGPGFW